MRGMEENPYQSPRAVNDSPRRPPIRSKRWHPITWGVIGFGVGTLVAVPFSWNIERHVAMTGGMLFGGVPGAMIGIAFGVSHATRGRWSDHDKPLTLFRGTAKAVAFYCIALVLAIVLVVIASLFWG